MKQVSDPASQLAYLIDMCRDKAYEAIRACNIISPPSEALKTALDKLSMKFGKKHVVVKAHLDSITKGPPIQADRESLDKLATDMANCRITLVQWGYDSELNSSQTLLDVFKRLPVHLQRKFSVKVDVYSIGYAATFSQLLSFVEDAADRANSLFGQALAQPARYNQSCPRKLKSGQVFSAQSKTVDERHCQRNPRDVCPSCNCNNHTLSNAGSFYVNPFRSAGTL